MPGQVAPIADEREGLLAYLAQQRYVLTLTSFGLTDAQARTAPTASPLSVGGLIKHVAQVEQSWIDIVLQRNRPNDREPDADYLENFRMHDGETLAEVLAHSAEVAAETEAAIASIPDLSQPVPVPRDAPWFPADVDHWSVRWVLLHLISETARHAGHADIVREHLDGATAFPLMAAAEHWPPSPWMQPWSPGDPAAGTGE